MLAAFVSPSSSPCPFLSVVSLSHPFSFCAPSLFLSSLSFSHTHSFSLSLSAYPFLFISPILSSFLSLSPSLPFSPALPSIPLSSQCHHQSNSPGLKINFDFFPSLTTPTPRSYIPPRSRFIRYSKSSFNLFIYSL